MYFPSSWCHFLCLHYAVSLFFCSVNLGWTSRLSRLRAHQQQYHCIHHLGWRKHMETGEWTFSTIITTHNCKKLQLQICLCMLLQWSSEETVLTTVTNSPFPNKPTQFELWFDLSERSHWFHVPLWKLTKLSFFYTWKCFSISTLISVVNYLFVYEVTLLGWDWLPASTFTWMLQQICSTIDFTDSYLIFPMMFPVEYLTN